MKKQAVLWCLLILLVSCSMGAGYIAYREDWLKKVWDSRPEQVQIQPGFYRVVEVADGDTISVDMNGVSERVRFIGVDTPETHDPDVPIQCFGPDASQYTTRLLNGGTVRLVADPTNANRDRYDRLLRYVYAEDGTLVNKSLIEQGYGFAYVVYPFEKKEEFLNAEMLARQNNRGLWAACQPVLTGGIYQTSGAF